MVVAAAEQRAAADCSNLPVCCALPGPHSTTHPAPTLHTPAGAAYRPDIAYNVSTIRAFDDAITRVSFGWPSVDAYYQG